MTSRTRLAVLGSPIAHSKSPTIHAAAYRELGLDWQYSAIEVDESSLPGFLGRLGADDDGHGWRGLSLTMPLKRDILPFLLTRSALVDVVGAANTVLVADDGLHGFNTDVFGIVEALADAGIHQAVDVVILGSGATAASVLAAVAQIGARSVIVKARTPANAEPLRPIADALGILLATERLDAPWTMGDRIPDLVVSTLPGSAGASIDVPSEVRSGAVLFDAAYDPWPSPLATAWSAVGGAVVPGLGMLLHQAIGQIRCFVHGDPAHPLTNERAVLDRMRESVGAAGSMA